MADQIKTEICNLPVNGSLTWGAPCPRVTPFVFSIIKLATWSRNMGLNSLSCRNFWAANQGSSLMLYGSFNGGAPSWMSTENT